MVKVLRVSTAPENRDWESCAPVKSVLSAVASVKSAGSEAVTHHTTHGEGCLKLHVTLGTAAHSLTHAV